jgi:hypothetical protein
MALLSHVEQLWIHGILVRWASGEWTFDSGIDASQWRRAFRQLTSLQSLYVSRNLVTPVTAALQELTVGRVMEVLPVLDHLFLEGFQPSGFVQNAIMSFLADRQLTGHPIVVQPWERQESIDYELDDDD